MQISSADPLKGGHTAYVVAVHLHEPLLEQLFVTHFVATYKLNRKLANRVLATQAVGNVFTLATRNKGPLLVCLVIGLVPGSAQLSDMNLCVRKAMGLVDGSAAVVAQGFLLAHEHRAPDEYGFECLRRALMRWGYTGTLYARPDPDATAIASIPPGEPTADKRFISRPDGTLRPSILPAIAGFGARTTKIEIKS